jgi:hypothetical protein
VKPTPKETYVDIEMLEQSVVLWAQTIIVGQGQELMPALFVTDGKDIDVVPPIGFMGSDEGKDKFVAMARQYIANSGAIAATFASEGWSISRAEYDGSERPSDAADRIEVLVITSESPHQPPRTKVWRIEPGRTSLTPLPPSVGPSFSRFEFFAHPKKGAQA